MVTGFEECIGCSNQMLVLLDPLLKHYMLQGTGVHMDTGDSPQHWICLVQRLIDNQHQLELANNLMRGKTKLIKQISCDSLILQ